MTKYPVYLNLVGKRVVVIGAGVVAARKIEALYKTGARILVIARDIENTFQQRCSHLDIEVIKGEYSKDYLTDAALTIVATNDMELNRMVYRDCQELKVICNVVDIPELCDFHVPAIARQGKLQIAISTDGASPAYAASIRKKLQKLFTPDHAQFLDELAAMRILIKDKVPESNDLRKILLENLASDESFEKFKTQGSHKWRSHAEQQIQKSLTE